MRTSKKITPLSCKRELTLERLYRLHLAEKLGPMDVRWDQVASELRGVATTTVRQVTLQRGLLYDAPYENAIEAVYTAVLMKFIQRRFSVRESFGSLLMTSARNALLDALRQSNSVSATTAFEGKEEVWESKPDHPPMHEKDLYDLIRHRLGPFRWAEYPHVREAVLSYFLTHFKLPGASFLNAFGVPNNIRASVYNAAAFDVNSAMVQLCEADINEP